LKCIGCYAASSCETLETLPYSMVDKIITEVHDVFANRFITISGGEPFMYRSEGKSLFDLFEKYNDMFFLVYTNGTLINDEIARRLAEVRNVTVAISVEGYGAETNQRRGDGVYQKILKAYECLRSVGVPFGASVTATSQNVSILLTDEFYNFYFDELGVSYMWLFQFMPIGRGKDEAKLMVTPETRVALYRQWEEMMVGKKYCIADFWNSGTVSRGCIAYGRSGGYVYVNWDGNIQPCAFVPYYVDNIYDLFANGQTLSDAMQSKFMKNGRRWQRCYGLDTPEKPDNWLMPCSIRDNYETFRETIITPNAKPENQAAQEALESTEYLEMMQSFDHRLKELTQDIWQKEYIDYDQAVEKETSRA
jgi:MoaA/NifB/PqqE/SkfB family radical SAM enzyme